jgi:hypothetical protein
VRTFAIMSADFFTDRSRISTYERCPRRRLIEYHWDGRGVVPDAKAVPLATGGAIHLGLQRLLEGASVDEAVQDALALYRDLVVHAGFQDTRNTDQLYTIAEQLALTEAMVRAWHLKRLPLILARYNVIEIEKEAHPTGLAPSIILLRRPDGVLENRASGFYEVLSFKTAKQYGFKNEETNIVDVQGISESWAVAQKYGEEKVGSVLMEFLVTGPRKAASRSTEEPYDAIEDDDVQLMGGGAPLKWQWNNLIRAWRDNLGNISWRLKVPGQDGRLYSMGKWFNPNYGKRPKAGEVMPEYVCSSFPVWEEMPVKEWFEKMASSDTFHHPHACGVFPQWCDPFEKMFISRRYERMKYELQEWQAQAGAQETRIAEAVGELANVSIHPRYRERIMNEVFPKFRHSCQYPTPCPYQKICWSGLTDPLSAGFSYRRPNHPQEVLP